MSLRTEMMEFIRNNGSKTRQESSDIIDIEMYVMCRSIYSQDEERKKREEQPYPMVRRSLKKITINCNFLTCLISAVFFVIF